MNISSTSLLWAAAIGGIGIFVALIFNELRRREDKQEQFLTTLVKSETNAIFKYVVDSERTRNEELGNLRAAEQDAARLKKELEQSVGDLQFNIQEAYSNLEKIANIIPIANKLSADSWRLYSEARSSTDPDQKQAFLTLLLEVPDADAAHLELGGDIARESLQSNSLASRLYERSLEVQPERHSVRAELLRLKALQDSKSRDDLLQLATGHPSHSIVVSRALDCLSDRDEYEIMERFCIDLLKTSALKSYLYRNLAIAQKHIGVEAKSVKLSFEAGLNASLFEQEDGRWVNCALPYADMLMSSDEDGDLDRAREVLDEAVWKSPSEPRVLLTAGNLRMRTREFEEAIKYFRLAAELGDPHEKLIAEMRFNDIYALNRLGNITISTPANHLNEPDKT